MAQEPLKTGSKISLWTNLPLETPDVPCMRTERAAARAPHDGRRPPHRDLEMLPQAQGVAGEACNTERKPVACVHKVDSEATVVAKFPRDAVGEVRVLVLDDDKGSFAVV
eukprot:3182443-Amphidinium_carterae.1